MSLKPKVEREAVEDLGQAHPNTRNLRLLTFGGTERPRWLENGGEWRDRRKEGSGRGTAVAVKVRGDGRVN